MSYDRIRTKPLSTATPSLELNWSIKWIKTSSLVVFGVIVVLLHIRLIQYIPLAWTVLWKQWQKNSQQVILKCFHSKFHITSVMLFKNQHMHTICVTCGILRFKLVQSFRKTICLNGAMLQDLTVKPHHLKLSCLKIYITWKSNHFPPDVTYQTRDTLFHQDIQILGRELKIWCSVEYFGRNWRCLDS